MNEQKATNLETNMTVVDTENRTATVASKTMRSPRRSRRSRSWDLHWRSLLPSSSSSSSICSSSSKQSKSENFKDKMSEEVAKVESFVSMDITEEFAVQKRRSSKNKEKNTSTNSRPRRSRSSGNHTRGRSKTGSSPMRKSVTSRNGKRNTVNTEIVNRYRECLKNHDIDGCVALTVSGCNLRYTGTDARVTNLKQFGEMMRTFVEACPDLSFVADDTVEIAPGIVVIENVVSRGTHTGIPFSFATYPPLPPNNVECVNDPENWIFFVCKGKIAKMHYHCFGRHHGPMGFYQQIKAGSSG